MVEEPKVSQPRGCFLSFSFSLFSSWTPGKAFEGSVASIFNNGMGRDGSCRVCGADMFNTGFARNVTEGKRDETGWHEDDSSSQ